MKFFDTLEAEETAPLWIPKLDISIGFDSALLSYGILMKRSINLAAPPHLGVVGASGSGKTYACTLILGHLSLYKEVELVVADLKGIDFSYLNGCKRFYRYLDVGEALDYVYEKMNYRIKSGIVGHPIVIFIDELSAYYAVACKKDATKSLEQLNMLLMISRGVNIFCIVSLQRADAAYFGKARDNIGSILALGSLSSESISMVLEDFKKQIVPKPRGKGYLKTDGKPLYQVTIPQVRDMEKLHQTIREAVNRPFE